MEYACIHCKAKDDINEDVCYEAGMVDEMFSEGKDSKTFEFKCWKCSEVVNITISLKCEITVKPVLKNIMES